jgi:hypothetical protein
MRGGIVFGGTCDSKASRRRMHGTCQEDFSFKSQFRVIICATHKAEPSVLSLCKLSGVKLCTLFGVSPRQQPRDSGRMDFE